MTPAEPAGRFFDQALQPSQALGWQPNELNQLQRGFQNGIR
ncbi:hypothetical protein [Vandammella animalimorsus]|nr:hypothetical protein [Vandammella animalimorsus]